MQRMKRALFLSSAAALVLVVACGSFGGSDQSVDGPGGNGDDGGGSDGNPLVTGGGGDKDGSSSQDAGHVDGDSAVIIDSGPAGDASVPQDCSVGPSILCQDFTSGAGGGVTDAWVNGVFTPGTLTTQINNIAPKGTLVTAGPAGEGTMVARVYGGNSEIAWINSQTLNLTDFTITYRFAMNLPMGDTAEILELATSNGGLTFTASDTDINVVSSSTPTPTSVKTDVTLPRTLSIVYTAASGKFVITTDDGGSGMVPYQNAVLTGTKIGARGLDPIQNLVTGFRVSSP